jgi:histone H3/H4
MRGNSGSFRISPGAVQEMISRFDMWFELNMNELCKIAQSHGRKTILEDDVVEFFSVMKNKFFEGYE